MKLPRLQLHLSTLMLLTVLAGAFIGANVQTVISTEEADGGFSRCTFEGYGWPWQWRFKLLYVELRHEDGRWRHAPISAAANATVRGAHVQPVRGITNALVAIAALALVGYVSERVIRRRKPEP